MGLLAKLRARSRAKIDAAREHAETEARTRGDDPAAVRAAGDKAARRQRRRSRATGYGGAGGTSG